MTKIPMPLIREPYCIHSHYPQLQPAGFCNTCKHTIYKKWVDDWAQWFKENPDHEYTKLYGPKND